jgi:hypothetical protein
LNLRHFDVQLRNWLRTHDPIDGFIADDHVKLLLISLVLIKLSIVLLLLHLSLTRGRLLSPCG